MITFLGLAHILECGWWVGGVGGMITYLGLAHIVVYGCGGMGGWDDNVPWTCTHSSLRSGMDGVGGMG